MSTSVKRYKPRFLHSLIAKVNFINIIKHFYLFQRMTNAQIQAQFYLNDKKIFELFNFLIGHLLVDEPSDPIEYLHDLLDKCMLFRAGLCDPPLLFTER